MPKTLNIDPSCGHPDRKYYAKGFCKPCYSREQHRRHPYQPRPKRPTKMATCHPDRPHIAKGFCQQCWAKDRRKQPEARARERQMATAWRQRQSKEYLTLKWRKHRLSQTYGLSLEDFDRRVSDQQGACAICSKVPKHTLCVDHCHATGKIRALLCYRCNSHLGFLELLCPVCHDKTAYGKDKEWIEKANDYISRYAN